MNLVRGFPLPAIVAAAGVYLASFLLLPAAGFWINDNAAKFIQMRAILDSGYSDFSIALPGRGIDPDLAYNPLSPPYFHVQGGRVYCQYSVVFALLSSLPYSLLGQRGLYLVPLLSSLFLLAGCACLAQLFGGDRRTAGLVVALIGLATPVWFYSLTYWEHAPSACLVVWGVYLLLRAVPAADFGRAFAGGLLLAQAVAFRDELYLFWLVAVGAVILRARARRGRLLFAATGGGVAGIVPLWVLQQWALGSALGFHVAGSLTAGGLAHHLSTRPRVFHDLFLAVGNNLLISVTVVAPFLVAVAFGRRVSRWNLAASLLAASAALSGLVFLGGFRGEAGGIMPWLYASNSLWPAAPVLVLAFLGGRTSGDVSSQPRTIVHVAVAYALLYAALTPDWRTQGLHWGNRLLFVLYPLLGVPAGLNLMAAWRASGAGRAWRRTTLAALTAVSLLAQGYSLTLLRDRMLVSAGIEEAIRADAGAAIVTDQWWIPQEIASVVLERPVFLVRSPGRLPELLDRLCRNGSRRYLLVTRAGADEVSPPAKRIVDTRFDFFAVDLLPADACGGRPGL